MKYFFVAGERSGDLHAGNLAKEINRLNPEVIMQGWGGDYMQSSGVEILQHYKDLAFMGFIEVVRNLLKVLGFMRKIKKQISEFKPDGLILVDYAGFNLRLAKWAEKNQIPTYYYIAPKAWAWNRSRVHKLRKYTRLTLCILPFEEDFFRKYGVNAKYIGNPLFDAIRDFEPPKDFRNQFDDKPIIALLPGSRKQEIEKMMQTMAEMTEDNQQYQWVVAGVDSFDLDFYRLYGGKFKLLFNKTYDLLSVADVAVVTSGTATLETALFKVPQVVVYKTNPVTFSIARLLVKIKHISLVNLVAEKEVVKELIQGAYNTQSAFSEVESLLNDTKKRKKQLDLYNKIIDKLGERNASSNAAKEILKFA